MPNASQPAKYKGITVGIWWLTALACGDKESLCTRNSSHHYTSAVGLPWYRSALRIMQYIRRALKTQQEAPSPRHGTGCRRGAISP
jgi:hypothetical protein